MTRPGLHVAGDVHRLADIPAYGEDKVRADADDDIGVALEILTVLGITEIPLRYTPPAHDVTDFGSVLVQSKTPKRCFLVVGLTLYDGVVQVPRMGSRKLEILVLRKGGAVVADHERDRSSGPGNIPILAVKILADRLPHLADEFEKRIVVLQTLPFFEAQPLLDCLRNQSFPGGGYGYDGSPSISALTRPRLVAPLSSASISTQPAAEAGPISLTGCPKCKIPIRLASVDASGAERMFNASRSTNLSVMISFLYVKVELPKEPPRGGA